MEYDHRYARQIRDDALLLGKMPPEAEEKMAARYWRGTHLRRSIREPPPGHNVSVVSGASTLMLGPFALPILLIEKEIWRIIEKRKRANL